MFALAFTVLGPVVAQTPVSDPVDELNKIASDVTIYGRSYQANLPGTPAPGETVPVMAIVQAYVFDDADQR